MHGGRNNFVVAGGQYREAKEGGSCLRRGNFFRVTLRTAADLVRAYPLIEVGENGLAPANHMEDLHVDTNIEMNQCLSDESLNDVVGGLGGRLGAVFRFAVYSPGSLGTIASAFSSAAHAVGSVIDHFKFW